MRPMRAQHLLGALAIVACFVTLNVRGQNPHLAYVYPAGGRTGTTFQITVGGQALMGASGALVSGNGVTATVLDRVRPMQQKEFNDLRDQLKGLLDKFQTARHNHFPATGSNVWTEADARERDELRAKILHNPPNRNAGPAMIDTVTFKVTIAADAEPGDRDLRLISTNAISNPLRFCVGTLPEVSRAAAKPANPDLEKYLARIGGQAALVGTPKHEAQVQLPVTVNGQILPGGVDRYRFFASAGQQLVIAASARTLIPYLADAVPGWFEATVTLLDAKGEEVASAERYRFKPDPVLHVNVPHDGMYTVEIHDSIFRGREDFVYRLTLGELPFITSIFPLGGRAGEKTEVTLTGWNLPVTTLTVNATTNRPGVIALPTPSFNSVPFSVDELPECVAGPPSHESGAAQSVNLPVIINGRISHPGEVDVFTFEGRAGQRIVAEVFARRLDSPLDSYLWLTDANGKQLAFNDDFEDKGTGLNTFHADSYLTNTLPATGTYFIHIRDTESQGGPDFAYRLHLSEPRPEFELRVVPSSVSLRTGMSAPLTVFALRRDGFTNAISLDLKNAPPGFALSGATLATNQDKVQFTLKAPPAPTEAPVILAFQGHATINGQKVTNDATPADDLMQAFFYRHLVPAQELVAVVNGPERPFLKDAFKILSATPIKIPVGGTARVRVSAPKNFSDRFRLELNNAPEGITLTNVTAIAAGLELVFQCDVDKLKPGSLGNLICDVIPQNNGAADPAKKAKTARKPAAVATLPAMPFTVTDK